MEDNKHILEQIGHKDGMTVPPGYFAEFASHMAASLPTTDFEKSAFAPIVAPKRTLWQKVRPYAYMAAMFAGVWCMLKMFTIMTTPASDYTLQPSPMLATALANDGFVNEYVIDDLNQWDLMDELMEEGVDVQSLRMPIDDHESLDYQLL